MALTPDPEELYCPSCTATNETEQWAECELYCEDCGSHPGLRCPNCGEEYDQIFDRLWKAQPQHVDTPEKDV